MTQAPQFRVLKEIGNGRFKIGEITELPGYNVLGISYLWLMKAVRPATDDELSAIGKSNPADDMLTADDPQWILLKEPVKFGSVHCEAHTVVGVVGTSRTVLMCLAETGAIELVTPEYVATANAVADMLMSFEGPRQ